MRSSNWQKRIVLRRSRLFGRSVRHESAHLLFAKLKRRNVYTVAYAIVAWS
jgi:hypothetical protein